MERATLWPKLRCIDRWPDRAIWSACNDEEYGKYAAIKVIDMTHEDNTEADVEFERYVLELAPKDRQPYLAELLDCWTDPLSQCVHLVMPLYPASLRDYIKWRKNGFTESDRLCAAEIVSAVSFLHGKNIIHLDIKPENVLVDLDGHLVLSDFGLSMRRPDPSERLAVCGTQGYIAPEIIEECAGAYDFAADIWSLGVTLFETVCKLSEQYFSYDSYMEDPKRLLVLSGAFADGIPDPNLRNLLKQMLLELPGSRLSITQIRNHSYFSTVNWRRLNDKGYPAPVGPASNQLVERYLSLIAPQCDS